jgi:hypothetical protein
MRKTTGQRSKRKINIKRRKKAGIKKATTNVVAFCGERGTIQILIL